MAKTSEAKAKVTLDSAQFEKAAKSIADAAGKMSSSVGTALASAGAAVLAVFGAKGIGAIINSAKGVLDLGEAMANAGKRAGLAAGQFYLFHEAMEKGVSRKTMAGLIGENAEILDRSASTFRDVAIKLWAVGEKIRGFWLGLMDRVAPVLSKLLDGALAQSLVSAGESFGGAIADSVKVIYQLAKDGKLWDSFHTAFKIAFEYAGERMLWLGNIAFTILKEGFSEAFISGITQAIRSLWDTVSKFAEHLADKLYGNTNTESAPEASGGSFLEKIKGMISGQDFKPSDDLAKEIAKFTDTVTESLNGYDTSYQNNPPQTYENNSRRAAFGADSLASIGGGGGVYTGLSVLDVNKSQLSELKQINSTLSSLTSGSLDTGHVKGATNVKQGYFVSRFQKHAPVQ